MNEVPAIEKFHTKFSRILLAVDSSQHSLATVEPVARLATATGAEVQVLHVWNLEVDAVNGHWDIETLPEARTLIADVVAKLTERGVRTTSRVDSSPKDRIPAVIVKAASEFGADLIAVGSRGLGDINALLLGSVSQRVLHDSDCPVLVVHAGAPKQDQGVQRLLVAVAGIDDAETATAAACAVAKGTEAEVMVAHVRYFTAGEGVAWIEPNEEPIEIVDAMVARLTEAGVKAQGRVIGPSATVADDIAALARVWNADMIVMGSRRPSRLGALLSSSVSHQVMHASDRPVLVAERLASDTHK